MSKPSPLKRTKQSLDCLSADSEANSFGMARGTGEVLAKVAHAVDLTEKFLLERQSERLLVAFENIREGLAMFDGAERLVMMNARYAAMYRVPSTLQQPGTRFSALLSYWSETGFMHDRESRTNRSKIESTQAGSRFRIGLLDGRTYEINEQPLPGGGWVSTHEDITDRVTAEQRISYLAEHDGLTGLSARSSFQARLEALVGSDFASKGGGFALLMLDLDRFKPINDLYGHSAGDHVLTEVAKRARDVFGHANMIARLGGDEFAILVETTDVEAIQSDAQRLIASIRWPIYFSRIRIEVGASIGIALFPTHATTAGNVMQCADRALFKAKQHSDGRSQVYFAELDAEELARAELIRRLPLALHTGELELHFQPIVDATNGSCKTAEALVRWTHPTRGRIRPEDIIAMAEESRFINQLGDWILRRALETARTWPDGIAVAVNLSASQFMAPGFSARVIETLNLVGVAPNRLELELTETVLCSDEAIETIRELREAGIRFSLDDFGTGYASMSYLLRFPFDRVKIDRSFVTDVDTRRDRRLIVEAVAGLATKLGLEIVAEGVETEPERAIVHFAGCTFLQGYLFSRPLSEADFNQFLKDNDHSLERPH